MREHLFELPVSELQELYIHETKALVFALEAGVPWEDLKYIRDSIRDITRYIDARMPLIDDYITRKSVDIIPPFPLSIRKPG